MSVAMEKEVRRLEKEIWELAGMEFNVIRPRSLRKFFRQAELAGADAAGSGRVRSTAVDILEDLAAQHPLPSKIIEYREIAKLKSTYVDSLPKLINRETGRLHTSFSQQRRRQGD